MPGMLNAPRPPYFGAAAQPVFCAGMGAYVGGYGNVTERFTIPGWNHRGERR